MAEANAEKFAQRAFNVNLLDERQLDSIWAELGSRDVSADQFLAQAMRSEYLTNYQVEKLRRGDRSGYFYGPCKVLYLVGSGTFARVFRAVHTETGRVLAVKVLRRRFSEDPQKTEQFLREGEMGMSLRHVNIVPIYDVFSERNVHFLTMDFIEGQNLREFVKVRGRLDPVVAFKLIGDVAAGLTYAATRGVTHRDLKMSNVLVASNGRAKLVDFGLAAAENVSEDAFDEVSNPRTIDYAGLEKCTGVKRDDPRSDIYFAGCILYHMLSGQAPLFETKDRLQRMTITRFQEILPISELVPDLPPAAVMVVNRAMELNPERRYQSPKQFADDVKLFSKRLEAPAAGEGNLTAPNESPEGKNHTVMIVDSSDTMQTVLRDNLRKLGYRVLVVTDPDRAVTRCSEEHGLAECVVFGAHSLGKKALDAFNKFERLANTKGVPAILLVGEKQKDLREQAQLGEHRELLEMPIRFGDFREALKRLVARPRSASQ